ncbi:hypothetical protein OS493_010331 [Desmophyllum pertusum]|uniref:Uncharacterized protein n=1 Tax=Desmophyllum pertusum TaxID=174260 RepID=A0A9X0A434_9CNID|nr:hypothetical protein OS493_010331 [Desmophyllum pertusum]
MAFSKDVKTKDLHQQKSSVQPGVVDQEKLLNNPQTVARTRETQGRRRTEIKQDSRMIKKQTPAKLIATRKLLLLSRR